MKERLKEILLKKSVVVGREFKLASGRTSDFYVDARMTTLDAEGATLCGKIFLEMLRGFSVAAVGGYSIGADPIVAAIAVLSFLEGRPLPAFIIRKEAKSHGTLKMIEGNFPGRQQRVALFDDVITSGGSILKGAQQVGQQGGTVAVIMAVLDRQEGGRELIEAAGYRFQSIFTKKELLGS